MKLLIATTLIFAFSTISHAADISSVVSSVELDSTTYISVDKGSSSKECIENLMFVVNALNAANKVIVRKSYSADCEKSGFVTVTILK